MTNKSETNNKVNPEKVLLETDQGIIESEEKKWGLPLKDVYKHGLSFYKEKEGKAMHLSYEDRLKLVAYTQQAAHGPLEERGVPPPGVLDVIGRDRRAAWHALGRQSNVQAMAGFLHMLDRLCPLFKPYLEAIQKDLEDKKQQEAKKQEEERAHLELQNRIAAENQRAPTAALTEEEQVQRIKDALNAQTYQQFLEYAQQQFPGSVEQQAVLLRQLQEQHYLQYVRQLAADQRLSDQKFADQKIKDESIDEKTEQCFNEQRTGEKDCNLNDTDVESKCMQTVDKSDVEYAEETRGEEESDGDDVFPSAGSARMWTRGGAAVKGFKASAAAAGGTATVGHGEALTVRVPTHPAAGALGWEFATDHYDIGFGLYFQWGKPHEQHVTLHVSDSDDDEEDDDDDDAISGADPERGGGGGGGGASGEPRSGRAQKAVTQLVPVYRRDCHNEVYAGSHTYPGEGVYLLKFDNTYSLWRSKTLYYKVYYTQ